jgi:hypothetical protein
MPFLLRRTIRAGTRLAGGASFSPGKLLNVFITRCIPRINGSPMHLRFFRACGFASGRTSFALSRKAMSDRLLTNSIFLSRRGLWV